MPTVIENLFVAIRADSKGLDSDLKGVLGKFKKLEDVGKNLSRKISLPILALSGIVLKMAGDFESAMNTVAAKSGATAVEFKKLEDLAASLGATTRFSATQAAQGMAFLAQAGFDTNQILAALPATLNLASAGNLELARAADIASNVLKGFRLPAEEAGRAADVLALAAAKTNTDVEELGAAMSRIAPVASDLGVSMEETAAAIGALSDAGIKGFRAGTALRAIMAKLAGPTGQAAKAMEKLGIETRDLQGNFVGLPALMDQFAVAERNAADKGQFFADKVKIFGTEMVSSAGILINKGGPALQALTDEFIKAGGASQRMTNIMERGFVGGVRVLISALESLAIAVGNTGLLKLAENMTRGAAEFVRGLATMNKGVLAFGVTVAGLATAIPLLILGLGLIGPAFISGVASIGAMVSAMGTFSLAVSTGLVGALTAAEIALGALGFAVVGAAAALGILAAAFLLNRDGTEDWLSAMARAGGGVTIALAKIKESVTGVEKATREYGAELKRQADETIPQWVKRLREAKVELDAIEKEEKEVSDAALVMGQSLKDATDVGRFLQFLISLKDAEIAIQDVTKAAEASQSQVNKMATEMRTAATDAEIMADAQLSNNDQIDRLLGLVDKAGNAIKTFGDNVAEQVQKLRDSAESTKLAAVAQQEYAVALANSGQAIKDSEPARFSLEQSLERIAKQQTALTTAEQAATKAVSDQGASLKQLGGVFDQVLPKMSAAEALIGSLGEQLRRNAEQAELYATAQAILTERIAMGGEAGREAAEMLGLLNEKMGENVDAAADTSDAMQSVSTAVDDLSKKFADLLLGTAELGEVLKQFAQTIIRTIVEGAFKQLLDAMVLQDDAVKKLKKTWTDFLGIFGGGKKTTPNLGDVITGDKGKGGAGGGVIPTLDLLTGAISAISDVISNFQLVRIEKSLNFIELNTRQTARALIGDSAARVRGVLTTSPAAVPIPTGGESGGQKGFAVPLSLGDLFPGPNLIKKVFGGSDDEVVAAPFAGAGIGITGQLFALQDFASDQLAQLKFQTDSLDTLKDLGSRSEGLLTSIRDSLTGLNNAVSFGGGAVTVALLAQIKQALIGSAEGVDLISEIRNTVGAVRQHFVYDRDIVTPVRERSALSLEEIVKILKRIELKPTPAASISEFTQAAFRSQLNLGEAIP